MVLPALALEVSTARFMRHTRELACCVNANCVEKHRSLRVQDAGLMWAL